IGIDGTNITPNSGRIQVNLKPRNQRKETASEIIRDLQPELAKVEGITLYMQPVQDLTVESRVSSTQYQYSMEDADATELATWSQQLLQKLQNVPQLRDVASDQQNNGLQANLIIDRDTASRLGILPQAIDDTLYDAFGQRQGHPASGYGGHAHGGVGAAPGPHHFSAVEPVSRRAGRGAAIQDAPGR